jgi:hypothetical protein
MARRRRNPDRALEKLKAEWAESRKKSTLAKALRRCRDRQITEPPWLREAFYQLGRSVVAGMKKTGRKTNLLMDDIIYQTVEEHLANGLTQVKALRLTALEYRSVEFTVRSAWLRHRKRIVIDHPDGSDLVYHIRPKYLEERPRIPSYLKRK